MPIAYCTFAVTAIPHTAVCQHLRLRQTHVCISPVCIHLSLTHHGDIIPAHYQDKGSPALKCSHTSQNVLSPVQLPQLNSSPVSYSPTLLALRGAGFEAPGRQCPGHEMWPRPLIFSRPWHLTCDKCHPNLIFSCENLTPCETWLQTWYFHTQKINVSTITFPCWHSLFWTGHINIRVSKKIIFRESDFRTQRQILWILSFREGFKIKHCHRRNVTGHRSFSLFIFFIFGKKSEFNSFFWWVGNTTGYWGKWKLKFASRC